MSQVAHPRMAVVGQVRAHWIIAISAALTLMATVAVVLALAIVGGPAGASGPVIPPFCRRAVGAAGFEPASSRPQSGRDTRLRHAP